MNSHRIVLAVAAVLGVLTLAGCSRAVVRTEKFHVPDMHCADCVAKIRVQARAIPGVAACHFNLEEHTVVMDLSDNTVTREKLAAALTEAGFTPDGAAKPEGAAPPPSGAAPSSPAPPPAAR